MEAESIGKRHTSLPLDQQTMPGQRDMRPQMLLLLFPAAEFRAAVDIGVIPAT